MDIKRAIYFLILIAVFPFGISAQTISPQLVGTNAWYTNPSQQVWDLTAECGVKTIRIGGNAYNDNMPTNATLLGWIKKIQAIGAEPVVQISQKISASAAASVVHYLNVEKSGEIAPVKYWNIGNEPWLEANKPAISTVAPMVETYFKPLAVAMKEVDPTIKIYGPDFCYYITEAMEDLFGGDNNIAGKVPGKDYYYCDGLTWHRYPQDENINLAYEGIEDFKTSIVKCKQLVDNANTSLNRSGEDALIWGIGEYNAKGGPQVHTWENGQMFGGVLGLCMKYEAKYAASWSMFENGGSRNGTDFSFIDGANMTPRASYRHMQFVAKFITGEYVDGSSNTDDFVVYGAKDGDQTAVMVMHRADDSPKEYSLYLNDTASTSGNYILKVEAGLDKKYSDIISPRTTQVIIFKGNSITKINYSSNDFDNELPPVYSTFAVAEAVPETAGNLQANTASYSSIQLTWADSSNTEQGFIIERQINNVFEMVGVVPANSTSFTDEGLESETLYSYRIKAYNSLGKSDYTDIAEGTTLQAPAAKAYNGPHSIPGKIEAEDFNDNDAGIGYFDQEEENKGGEYRETGVDIEKCDEGGYNVGYLNEGEWTAYLIENVTPGTYDLAFRTASNNNTTSKKVEVVIDDSTVGSIVPNYTQGWQNFETILLEDVEIPGSDPVLMTLKFFGGSFNFNWVEFIDVSTSVSNLYLKDEIKAFYNSQNRSIIVKTNRQIDNADISVVNINGQTFYKHFHQQLFEDNINANSWANGVYFISVATNEERHTYKVCVN